MRPRARRDSPCAWGEPGEHAHGSGHCSIPRRRRAEREENGLEMNETYVTKHHGLASFLLYSHPDSYLETEQIGEYSFLFRFDDADKCIASETAFFDGVGVTNAKELTDCTRTIRQTTAEARKSPDGIYRREVE